MQSIEVNASVRGNRVIRSCSQDSGTHNNGTKFMIIKCLVIIVPTIMVQIMQIDFSLIIQTGIP